MTFYFVCRYKQILFFLQVNNNCVTKVDLTNDELCLIHNLRVEKHLGSEKNLKLL